MLRNLRHVSAGYFWMQAHSVAFGGSQYQGLDLNFGFQTGQSAVPSPAHPCPHALRGGLTEYHAPALPSPEMAQILSQPREDNKETPLYSKFIRPTLKEFFDPLRTSDSCADFFAVYHKKSKEFDHEYVKKYDDDLDIALIFAGLFSAVTSAFIAIVQPKLEPDQSKMTAVYMQILIHTMNNSLFPDADPASVAWTGPPPEIVTVQSMLYASLATALFAAFVAMLGKQWINEYDRNRGGSAADKSRDRQRKFDGLNKWRFSLVIESLPVVLQLALLLLWSALSLYLWNISRTVSWVILSFTLLGMASYVSITLAAILHDHCPYQTPPSIGIHILSRYLSDSRSTFAHSLRSLSQFATRLRTGARKALQNLGPVPDSPPVEGIPLADVHVGPPSDQEIPIDWGAYKTDVQCISWTLSHATDIDVIFSTALFAADMTWYPEIASIVSPHALEDLKDLFPKCLLGGRVIPDKLEHVNAIGLALASVLSIQLCMEPKRKDLKDLCRTIRDRTDWVLSSEPTFLPGMAMLRIVSQIPWGTWSGGFKKRGIFSSIPDHSSTAHGLCLSRTTLQTIWRWRRADPTAVLNLEGIDLFFKGLMANDDHIVPTIKINCFLIMTVSLGHQVPKINNLFIPNDKAALSTATIAFHEQLLASIPNRRIDSNTLTLILSAISHLDPFRITDSGQIGFEWMTEILKSDYPDEIRHQMTGRVVQLLGKEDDTYPPKDFPLERVLPLLDFLSLSEKFYPEQSARDAGLTALRILFCRQVDVDLGKTPLPILISKLLQDCLLQSRRLALGIFHRFLSGWFSPQMETVSDENLSKLLRAVGDPFKYPDLPLQYGQSGSTTSYEPMMAAVVLIEFASSDLWRDRLNRSNFDSCEKVLSTEEGRRAALRCMRYKATHTHPTFLRTPAKITAAIGGLEELQCFNTAEVVILWAWTPEVTDQVDHDDWRLIWLETVRFYRTHGMERLTTLKRHTIDNRGTIGADREEFLLRSVDSVSSGVRQDHGAGGGAFHQGEGGCH